MHLNGIDDLLIYVTSSPDEVSKAKNQTSHMSVEHVLFQLDKTK